MTHLSPKFLIFLFVLTFIVGAGEAAKHPETKKLPHNTISHGFCCVDSRIISTDEKKCRHLNGSFSSDMGKAKKNCVNHPQHLKKEPPVKTPVQGYCCDNAKVHAATKQNCLKKKGYFSKKKATVDKKCAQTRGFCCNEGKYSKTLKGNCDHLRGTFFIDGQKGLKSCQATKGYCCNKRGTVSHTSKGNCDRFKGKFYREKNIANNACKELPHAKTVHSSDINTRSQKLPRQYIHRKPESPAIGYKMILPDLIVTATGVDRNCFLTVTVKNSGGTITDIDHNRAQIYISAGPGNVLSKEKRYLRVIDPKGKLKRTNGVVSYTTDLTISGRQTTMVWLDTGHHITESNENNNGDDKNIVCRTTQVFAEKINTSTTPLVTTGKRPPVRTKPVNQEPKDGVMYNLTRSITVISPTQGDFLTQGDQTDIIWNVEGDLETDCMNISLQRDTGSTVINQQYHDTRQGASTHYQQGYRWHIPNTPNLQGPAYWIRVQTCDDTVIGESGRFMFPGINPEYSVSNIRISPPSPHVGDTINIMADITNMGGINSNEFRSFTLEYNIYEGAFGNPMTFDSVQLQAPPLGFGGRYQFSRPYTLTQEGNHRVYFNVLPYPVGQNMDPFLENNYGWFEFTVGPEQLPDLIVCMKKQTLVDPPGSFTFPARIENIGNSVSTAAKLSFFVTGNGTRHYDVPALYPGQISVPQRTLYWSSTGHNHFKVHIDYNDKVEELSNDNNILVGKIIRGKYGTLSKIICSDHPDAQVPVP